MNVKIFPSKIRGTAFAPSSKSYLHRYLIASFLSNNETAIKFDGNISDDVLSTINALKKLGASISIKDKVIKINGGRRFETCKIDVGDSATTLRVLMPIVLALNINTQFICSKTLKNRPINELKDVLSSHGAKIDDYNLTGKIKSGNYRIVSSVSSQYISGLLFALPLLDGDSNIIFDGEVVSKDYIEMTLKVLNDFGIKIIKNQNGFFIPGNQKFISPKTILIEGDYSNGSFFLCAGAISGKICVKNLNSLSIQGDKKIIEILKDFGAKVKEGKNQVCVKSDKLFGTKVDIINNPDLAPFVAVLGAYSCGETTIFNTKRLIIKESNRLLAIEDFLQKAGICFKEFDNYLVIYGGKPKANCFSSFFDHRIIMAITLLTTFCNECSEIFNAEYIKKSFPNFYLEYNKIGGITDVSL